MSDFGDFIRVDRDTKKTFGRKAKGIRRKDKSGTKK